MERLFTGTTVVLVWGAFNAMLAAILGGFTAAGLVGGAGRAGILAFSLYAASTTLVFLIALAVWGVRRRRAASAARPLPPRPLAALLLALAVAMSWVGLAVGPWIAITAIGPLIAAITAETWQRSLPAADPETPSRSHASA